MEEPTTGTMKIDSEEVRIPRWLIVLMFSGTITLTAGVVESRIQLATVHEKMATVEASLKTKADKAEMKEDMVELKADVKFIRSTLGDLQIQMAALKAGQQR